MLAYNLGSVLCNELENARGSGLDLGRFHAYVLKAGARVVKHARRLVVRVAQSVQRFWKQLSDCSDQWELRSKR